ncbi:type 3 dihydrofolate reductase [Rheinheimera sp. MMS21-TC3]|uniref:type 3 dihydrofolate reductase n=1 Tax=Rheinheimera sp. MMS21-TC3 TaxID=3072790 RepID=UPI0028C480B8|nr:type 3 dihydrofolate reductase [Rheinheimera sp. MMS21-TC3]WNO62148.1 type 3 dihydrofolate reductase [Rheinheimera sp. MMS21-TC3]
MKISMVAAMANNRVIGLNNEMPWHLPIDLQHFKKVTMGKPVIMGRKTFESIGRLLPNRRNIVISRQAPAETKGAEWVGSLEQAFTLTAAADEVMVIGGGQIYQQCLPLAERLYLTEIDLTVDGDAYFPDYLAAGNWSLVAEHQHNADAANPFSCRFITLERQ